MSWLERLTVPVEKLVGGKDPGPPVSNGMTLRQTVGKSRFDSEFDSLLVLSFASIAPVLAAALFYATLACLVAQQTSAIGIRLALGAERKQVSRKILFNRPRPALVKLVLGLAGSAAAVLLIQNMLYEIAPMLFTAVATTLLAVAMLACAVPAWRACRLDPEQALRTE